MPWGGECANGVTEPDQSLRTQQGQCSSCKNGYHLDNGLCKENRCVCDHGTPDSDCPENGQQKCGACDAGYYRKYTENVHRLPEGTNVNDLSTQCVARSRKNVNHGYELEAIRKQPVGCDPSYDEATVQYLMKTYNFDENDLRKSICLQTPENKKLVCDTGYFPNSSGDACVSCSPQENCNQNGSTCTNNIITCVTPKPGFYLDNGEVRACTVQANCNKHGDRCVGTKRTCTEAAAGYEIDESGLVKKQTCTDQANCEAHSSTECVIMDGERKNICVNANRGFYVSSGGKVQACTSQEHCISHFPVGDRDCVEKTKRPCARPEDRYYLENDIVVQCKPQSNCQTHDDTSCVRGTTFRKCTYPAAAHLIDVDGRVLEQPACGSNQVLDNTCFHERYVNARVECRTRERDPRGFDRWVRDSVKTEAACKDQGGKWWYQFGSNQRNGNRLCESLTNQTICNKYNKDNNILQSCVWGLRCTRS